MKDNGFSSDVFTKVRSNLDKNELFKKLISELESYSVQKNNHVYVIDRPLLQEEDFSYEYSQAAVIFVPYKKIIFCDFEINSSSENDNSFNEFVDDFLTDLNSLASKYKFQSKIGRVKKWKNQIVIEKSVHSNNDLCEVMKVLYEENLGKEEQLIQEVILSLAIGSVNNANTFKLKHYDNLLDIIKNKIIIFDADQTTFMYKNLNQKRITIQGLAGTGKTELLLHKLVNLYTSGIESKSKIVFTFFNKILENKTIDRIISFFNYMQVTEQIMWNKRLWVMRGWGNRNDKDSGVYSYICSYYNLAFKNYREDNNFGNICQQALEELNTKDNFEPCFDDILIDESQDFPESFFELCEKVSKNKVIIAGDIFQNIFSNLDEDNINPDFLLNRVYRTDPRTFMFAQSIGFAIQEHPVIRWLSDAEWKSCGYSIKKININDSVKYELTRSPIRRFDNVDNDISPFSITLTSNEKVVDKIIERIKDLKASNSTMKPSDLAVIFLTNSNDNTTFEQANLLEYRLEQEKELKWKSNKGYETGFVENDTVFISNQNNIKGLEFPFIICIVHEDLTITKDSAQKHPIGVRNSLYMMLTRSFISSHLILVNNEGNKKIFKIYKQELSDILQTNKLIVDKPGDKDILSTDKLKMLSTAVNMNPDRLIIKVLKEEFEGEKISISQDKIRKIISILKNFEIDISDYLAVKQYVRDSRKYIIGILKK